MRKINPVGRAMPISLLAFTLNILISCGGASESGNSINLSDIETGNGIVITGKIDLSDNTEPSLALQKMRFASKNDDQDLNANSGQIYTLQGKHLGDFVTDTQGNFTTECNAEDLSEDEETLLVITTEIGIEKILKVNAAHGIIDAGTADIVTTLAVQNAVSQLENFTGWGADYSEAETGLACLYDISEALWNNSDENADSIAKDFDQAKNLATAQILESSLNANNSLSSSAAFSEDSVSLAVADFLGQLVFEDLNSSADQVSLCENIDSGNLDPEIIVAPLLEAADLNEFASVYGNDQAAKVHAEILEECLKKDSCEKIKEQSDSVFSALQEFDGDYSELFSGNESPDAELIENIVAVADKSNSNAKVTICHIPPGNPDNAHEITVSENAIPAHLAHGDVLGECPEAESEPLAEDVVDTDPEIEIVNPDDPQAESNADELGEIVDELIADVEADLPAIISEEIIEAVENPQTEPLVVAVLDEAEDESEVAEILEIVPDDNATDVDSDNTSEEDAIYDQLVQTADSDLLEEIFESIFGQNPQPSVQEGLTTVWQYQFGHIFGGFYRMIPGPSAAIGDLRPDVAGLEIVTGNEEYYPLGYSGPKGRWFMFKSDGSVAFWKDTENDEAHSSVNLYDLDADGKLEMLGGTTSGNQIQAIKSNGSWMWRHILGSHSISTPAVAKLSENGEPKVFSGSMDGYVRRLNGLTGNLEWSFNTGQWIWASAAVADLDGDAQKEVLIAAYGGMLYCLNANTGTLKWSKQLAYNTRASAGLADIDADGILEVLIGDGAGVFWALSGHNGAVEWKFNTQGAIQSSAAIGDIDGDDDLEIVFGSADGNVYALNANGTKLWNHAMNGIVYSSPALAKRHVHDDGLAVYAASLSGKVVVIDGVSGNQISALSAGYEIVSSPAVGDVDGDGKLEVFFQDRRAEQFGMQGDTFWAVRDEGSLTAAFSREWPMFRNNPEHTGVYGK